MATPVTGYLSRVSGPRRSPRYDLHLACLLILVAGMLNSAGFVAVALYTSHMTGLTATMADHLVDGDVELLSLGAVGLGAFVLGGIWCSLLFTWGRRRGLGCRFANVLAFEGALILVFSLTAEAVEDDHRGLVPVAVIWNPAWVIELSGQGWVAIQFVAALVLIASGVFIKVPRGDS